MSTDLVVGKTILELGSGTGFLGIIVASLQVLLSPQEQIHKSRLWLTDVNDQVLQRCSVNINLLCSESDLDSLQFLHSLTCISFRIDISSRHPKLHVRPLDWSDALDPPLESRLVDFLGETEAELVLGADIVCSYIMSTVVPPLGPDAIWKVYHPDLIPALLGTLKLALNTTTSETGSESSKPKGALLALTVRNEETMQSFLGALGKGFSVVPVRDRCSRDRRILVGDQNFVVDDITGDAIGANENVFFERLEGIDQEVRLLKITHP